MLVYLLGILLLVGGAFYAISNFSKLPPPHRAAIFINLLSYPAAFIAVELFFPDAWAYAWVFVGLALVLLVTFLINRSGKATSSENS